MTCRISQRVLRGDPWRRRCVGSDAEGLVPGRSASLAVRALVESEDDVDEEGEDEDGDEDCRTEAIVVADRPSLPMRAFSMRPRQHYAKATHLIMTARQKNMPVP
jgi:hypothetical protein